MDGNDDEKRGAGSHAAMWPLVVVAAFVLYVLSIGPVAAMSLRGWVPATLDSALSDFYAPVVKIVENSWLEPLFLDYMDWWIGPFK